MSFDLTRRFGFLVNEVGRCYGRRFDQLARQGLGLSRAQCRLLATVTHHEAGPPLSQAALAELLDLTPMAVASLCDRMESAGWLQRRPCATDRRVKELALQPAAHQALRDAMKIGDAVQAEALAGLSAEEQAQLMALLQRVRANLLGAP